MVILNATYIIERKGMTLTDIFYIYCVTVTDCGVPASPINGHVEFSSNIYSIVNIIVIKIMCCLDMTRLSGLNGGRWSGVVPLCRSK